MLHYASQNKHSQSDEIKLAFENILQNSGLKLEQISTIVCASGPGSFTGVRIGLSFVLGLTAFVPIKVVYINNLLANINFNVLFGINKPSLNVVSIVDGLKNEVYLQQFTIDKDGDIFTEITPAEPINIATNQIAAYLTAQNVEIDAVFCTNDSILQQLCSFNNQQQGVKSTISTPPTQPSMQELLMEESLGRETLMHKFLTKIPTAAELLNCYLKTPPPQQTTCNITYIRNFISTGSPISPRHSREGGNPVK